MAQISSGSLPSLTLGNISINSPAPTISSISTTNDLTIMGTAMYSNVTNSNPMLLRNGRVGGIVAYTYDSQNTQTTNAASAVNSTYVNAVYLVANQVISSLGFVPSVSSIPAGATIQFGLYTSNGILVASTAVITNADTFTSTIYNFYPVGTPYTIQTSGFYYLAFGTNGVSAGISAYRSVTNDANVLNYPNISAVTNGQISLLRVGRCANGGVNLPADLNGFSVANHSVLYLIASI